MALRRSIGKWGLTALIVNTVIGSGIFGVPSELNKIVGRASPLAFVLAGIGMGLVMACFAEVASQFTEPGGAYLYARTAFGSFAGVQVAWFSWLVPMGAAAASSILVTNYLAGYWAPAASGAGRALVLAAMILLVTIFNYIGVRSGTRLSSVFTVAKLLPMVALIAFGLLALQRHAAMLTARDVAAPGLAGWSDALLLLAFAYAGFETCMLPTGEMKDPRRAIPAALGISLIVIMGVYTLLQFVVVATIGTSTSDRPLAATASVLVGGAGALLVTAAAMVSAYGNVSALLLGTPRVTYAMAERGEFPRLFARVHPRFQTPHLSILIVGALTLGFALTGTFRWALMLASGGIIIVYAVVCASLIKLRQMQPSADALRVPAGKVVAVICVALAAVLLSRLSLREGMVLGLVALIAAANWLWARGTAAADER